LTVASATSAPPLQPLCRQRNVYHPLLNRFTRQTHPTLNRKHLFMNIPCNESFRLQEKQKRTLISVVYSSSTVAILSTETGLWTCARHEAGLCCYLALHIENLLNPLQLFYFRLWPIYWCSIAPGRPTDRNRSANGVQNSCNEHHCTHIHTILQTARINLYTPHDKSQPTWFQQAKGETVSSSVSLQQNTEQSNCFLQIAQCKHRHDFTF
jgi:hypothetical protein